MAGCRNALLIASSMRPAFGEKYANPGVLPTGNGTGVAFSPAGDAVAVVHANLPRITAYSWSSNGFGAKYPNPATTPTNTPGAVAFTPNGSHVITLESSGTTHRLVAYEWSSSTGFGAKQTLVLPGLVARSLKVLPGGGYIAVVGAGSYSLLIVPWTGTTFGSQVITPPQPSASDDSSCVDVTPDGVYVAHDSQAAATQLGANAAIRLYSFSGNALSSPAQVPNVLRSRGIAFDNAGSTLFMGEFLSGFGPGGRLAIRRRSATGFDIPVQTGGSPIVVGPLQSLSVSPQDTLLAVGRNSSTTPLEVYRLSGGAISHRFADPVTLPTGPVTGTRAVAFSPSGGAVAIAHSTSPFITAYTIAAGTS